MQQEVLKHPELMERLSAIQSNEVELRMAAIATYCEVMLDGLYTVEELCKVLMPRLVQKRHVIQIITH